MEENTKKNNKIKIAIITVATILTICLIVGLAFGVYNIFLNNTKTTQANIANIEKKADNSTITVQLENENAEEDIEEIVEENQEELTEEEKQELERKKVEEEKKKQEEEKKRKEEELKKYSQTYNYYLKVNYSANTVTAYAKDANGNYTVPVRPMVCSTGAATPKSGVYKTKNKYRWKLLIGNSYGQYSTRITGQILFHSVPYEKQSEDSLITRYYDRLGITTSMGCIRLTVADAKWIYDNCPLGTCVEFYSSSNPGPLGKPSATKITNAGYPLNKWDPTDPNSNNPWKKQTTNSNTTTSTNTTNNTANNTTNNTVNNTTNKPTNNTVNNTTNKPANNTVNNTTNKPTNNTVNNTTNKPINNTVNNVTNKPRNNVGNNTTNNK